MDIAERGIRSFSVDPAGIASELRGSEAQLQNMGVSAALSAAVDVLQDAGEMTEERVALLVAAEQRGDDPEAFARHLLTLIGAVRTG